MEKLQEINADMTELLKLVARDHLYRTQINNSDNTKRMIGKVEEKLEQLIKIVSSDQKDMLTDLDEAFSQLITAETEDHYIKGFMQGYLFLLKNKEKNHFAGNEMVLGLNA